MSDPIPLEDLLYEPLGCDGSRNFRLLKVELERPPLPASGISWLLALARGYLDDFAEAWLPAPYYYYCSSLQRCAIKCQLSTHSLDAAPPYRALSYTWGDPTVTEPIHINGHTVEVTRNLLAALRRIARDPADDAGGGLEHGQQQQLLLWVDALCINQRDNDEKSQQIPMMSDIYGRASLVYVWLGEEQSHTSRALSFVRKSVQCQWFIQQQATTTAAQRSEYESHALRLASSLDSASTAAAMRDFFRREYWGRVWVLQEVAYASNAVIVCGRHRLPFSELCWASYFWRFVLGSSFTPNGTTIFWNYELERFDMFREVTLGHSAQNQPLRDHLAVHGDAASRALLDLYIPRNENLFDLLVATALFKATDPRDRFYALLNLLPAEKRLIEPDYHMPTAACHHKIIVQGITQYETLDCISLGGVGAYGDKTGPTHPDLPSWVPDFSRLGGEDPNNPNVASIAICMMKFGSNRICASLEKSPRYSFSQDLTLLTLEGFRCDGVKEVVSSELRLGEGYQWGIQVMEFLGMTEIRLGREGGGSTSLYRSLLRVFQPEEFGGESFFRTALPEGLLSEESVSQNLSILASGFMLLAGFASRHTYAQHWMDGMRSYEALLQAVVSNGDPALSYLVLSRSTQYLTRSDTARALERQAYEQAQMAFHHDRHKPNGAELILWHQSKSSTFIWKSVTPDMSMQQFWHSLFRYWRCRKLVVTHGGFMGFARPGTQAGDGVYILHGCRAPVILRGPVEGNEHQHQVLVGDAYFYGMMKGEMVKKQEHGEEGGFPLENVTLR